MRTSEVLSTAYFRIQKSIGSLNGGGFAEKTKNPVFLTKTLIVCVMGTTTAPRANRYGLSLEEEEEEEGDDDEEPVAVSSLIRRRLRSPQEATLSTVRSKDRFVVPVMSAGLALRDPL